MDKYANLGPDSTRDAENSIAFWFPKIRDCGIAVPRTMLFDTPPELFQAFYMSNPKQDMARIQAFVEDAVLPAVRQERLGRVFLKNGCLSDKFHASDGCLADAGNMASALVHIMQAAMECCGFQYDGTDVIAVRERIRHDPRKTACIYHGLPFRTEYRAFYDFDDKKLLFVHDYWDKDYVYPHLRDRTDKVVYDACYPEVRARHEAHVNEVSKLMTDAMGRVEGMSGSWSVDVLEDEDGKFWLIDMALAPMSAYWEKRPGAEPAKEVG